MPFSRAVTDEFSSSLLPADLAALVSAHVVGATYETVALRVSAGYLGDEAYTGHDDATRALLDNARRAFGALGFSLHDALCGGFADEVWETWFFQRVYVG
jgi:hypothetical protein